MLPEFFCSFTKIPGYYSVQRMYPVDCYVSFSLHYLFQDKENGRLKRSTAYRRNRVAAQHREQEMAKAPYFHELRGLSGFVISRMANTVAVFF